MILPLQIEIGMDPELTEFLKDSEAAQMFLILAVIWLLIQVTKTISEATRAALGLFGWLQKRDEAEAEDDTARNDHLRESLALLRLVMGPIQTAVEQGNVIMARNVEAVTGLDATLKTWQGRITRLEGETSDAKQAIADHDLRTSTYITNSNSREQETLDIVRGLPGQITAVSTAIEVLRADALDQLKAVQNHVDLQFDAAKIAINAAFTNMAAAMVATKSTEPEAAETLEREAIGKLVDSVVEPMPDTPPTETPPEPESQTNTVPDQDGAV